ncbi:MAG: hypothetical protein P1V51_01510 [Deltaproteobacteria bacterium]|nr:hypothetical protein [Deltaproteobacteria bacterium]
MNGAGHESANALMVEGRTLPLLQDLESVDAWGSWSVIYRDVIILDPDGVATHAVNLSAFPLDDQRRIDALEALLRYVADEL